MSLKTRSTPTADHVVFDGNLQAFQCLGCQARLDCPLPTNLRGMVEKGEAFRIEHKDCANNQAQK